MRTRRLGQVAVHAASCTLALGYFCAMPVVAEPQTQASDTGGLEEVMVTSRRIEENLQDTPIAVTAFLPSDIERLTIRNVADTAEFTPNFLANPGPTGGNDAFYFIRGVGQTDLNPATDPGVPTYLDGVYLGRVMGSSLDTSDIARIEVLRGPQGTLFGRNTIGGAVSITTVDPAKEFGGELGIAGGSRNLRLAHAAVDIPITDTQGLHLSAELHDQNGWGHRVSDGTIFDTTNLAGGNLKYKWSPSDSFALTLSGDLTHVTGTSQQTILIGFNPTILSPLGVPIPPGMANYLNPSNPYNNYSSINPDKNYETKGIGLRLDGKMGDIALQSITAYRRLNQYQAVDYDSSPYSFYEGAFYDDQHQFSQELHVSGDLGRAKWLFGTYYYDEYNSTANIVSLGGNNGCLPFPTQAPPGDPFYYVYPVCNFAGGQAYATPGVDRRITNNQAFTLQTKAYAMFGESTIKITDQWSGTVGLRWTEERKTQDYNFFINNTDAVANAAGLPPAQFYTLSPYNPANTAQTAYQKTWVQMTPKAGVEWKPQENFLYYFSYSKGFKSGGFDGRPNPNAFTGQFGAITPFNPETNDTFELGAKTQFFENHLRVNAALFQENYKGIQLLAFDPTTGYFNTVTADQRIRGGELEIQARPIEALQMDAGVGYTQGLYTSLPPPNTGILYGMQLPLTPLVNGSLGAQYTWTFGAGKFTLRSDYSFRTEFWFQAANSPLSREGGYGLLNGRATWDFADGHWSLAAYGLNLTNKFYYTNAQDVTAQLGIAFAAVSPPREWGGEVHYRFGH